MSVKICGVCFTSSWEPCLERTPDAVPDDSTGGWMVCGYCALQKSLESYKQWHGTRWELLQKWQATIPDPYRQEVCDILANGMSLRWNERKKNINERRIKLVRLINRLDDEEQFVDAVDEAIAELRSLL